MKTHIHETLGVHSQKLKLGPSVFRLLHDDGKLLEKKERKELQTLQAEFETTTAAVQALGGSPEWNAEHVAMRESNAKAGKEIPSTLVEFRARKKANQRELFHRLGIIGGKAAKIAIPIYRRMAERAAELAADRQAAERGESNENGVPFEASPFLESLRHAVESLKKRAINLERMGPVAKEPAGYFLHTISF